MPTLQADLTKRFKKLSRGMRLLKPAGSGYFMVVRLTGVKSHRESKYSLHVSVTSPHRLDGTNTSPRNIGASSAVYQIELAVGHDVQVQTGQVTNCE